MAADRFDVRPADKRLRFRSGPLLNYRRLRVWSSDRLSDRCDAWFAAPDVPRDRSENVGVRRRSEDIAEGETLYKDVVAAEERLSHISFYEPTYENSVRSVQLARARHRATQLLAAPH